MRPSIFWDVEQRQGYFVTELSREHVGPSFKGENFVTLSKKGHFDPKRW
jgi:hypothetical protein